MNYFVGILMFFLLLYSESARSVYSEELLIPVCCPLDWQLVKYKPAGSSKHEKFDCLDKEQVIAQNLTRGVDILGVTLPVFGLGIEEITVFSNTSQVPQCSRQELLTISKEIDAELSSNSCLASVDDAIIAISCPSKRNSTIKNLTFLHKCCPNDYVYNSRQRKCVRSSLNFGIYSELIPRMNDAAIFVDDRIDCPRDKVLVEYHLSSKKLMFDDSHVMLKNLQHKKTFDIHSYCVEAIVVDGGISLEHFVKINDTVHEITATRQRRTQEYIVRICDDADICKHESLGCIRRCCNDGEMFAKGGNATSYCKRDETDITFHSFESLEISGNYSKPSVLKWKPFCENRLELLLHSVSPPTSVFGILHSLDCKKFRLDPDSYADEAHIINENDGSLYVSTSQKNYTNNQYCVEKVHDSTSHDQKLYTFLCFDSKVVGSDKIRFKMYPVGLLISCTFYLITLIVYLSISRLRNLPGKILICLVSSLFSAYLSIALGQLMPTPNDDVCFASGFFVYFCLMSAFAWMNVMCFDIWRTFGSAKKKGGFRKKDNKRFILYSLYGWGLPTTLTVLTVSLTKADVLSESIKPHFGHGRCWFTYDTLASANLLFFSGPVGILFLINLVLFLLTLRYCNRVKREIYRMQSSNLEKPVLKRRFFVDKSRFTMNTKLFIVMGITWLLELLSIAFYDHKKTFFWAISDSFNVLLGVFVFFIFVFKKRIWYTILERLGIRPVMDTRTYGNATLATPSAYTRSISLTRLNAVDGNVCSSPKGPPPRSPLL